MRLSHLSWCLPPESLTLGSDEVHVWRIALELPAECVQNLLATLAADERARAEHFRFQKDSEHFIVGRGVLRAILSGYLNMEGDQLRFRYARYGKPSLVPIAGVEPLNFNLSHSGELALCAVTRGRELGVDIEYMRPKVALIKIAERFFSLRESAELRALPVECQRKAFFNCWTRKEAIVKAKGGGLSITLSEFDVSLVDGQPAALLSTKWDAQETERWSLKELHPGAGYVAALAVEGHDWHLNCWQW